MITTDRIAEKTECIARELLEYAKELRHGEGDFRWQPATLKASHAVREQLALEDAAESAEPQTFQEMAVLAVA